MPAENDSKTQKAPLPKGLSNERGPGNTALCPCIDIVTMVMFSVTETKAVHFHPQEQTGSNRGPD